MISKARLGLVCASFVLFSVACSGDNGSVGPPSPPGPTPACVDYRANPHIVGYHRARASGITIVGSLAYVADADSLLILDISSASPILVGATAMTGYGDVAVNGNYAYVAVEEGVRVVDVTTPSAPVALNTVTTPQVTHPVVASGNYLYTGDFHGVRVMDISNPQQTAIISNVVLARGARGLAVDGNHAFAGNDFRFYSIDISNPSAPAIMDSIVVDGIYDVAIDGSYAYVVRYGSSSGMDVINISNPANMTPVAGVALDRPALGIAVDSGFAYVANSLADLRIIDISNPFSPRVVSGMPAPGNTNSLAVSGSRVYLAQGESGDGGPGFFACDVSSPVTPVLGTVPAELVDQNPDWDGPVQVVGNTVYALSKGQLQIIDISNPATPHIVGSLGSEFDFDDIAVAGDRVCLAGSFTGFTVVDVSNPASPAAAGHLDMDYPYAVTIAGSVFSGFLAYVATSNVGLEVVHLSSVSVIGELDVSGAVDVAVSGNRTFLVRAGGNRVQVVNISAPSKPALVGELATQARHIVVDGKYMYLLDGFNGVEVATLDDNPTPVGQLDTPTVAMDIAFYGNTAFIADRTSLQIVDRQDPRHMIPIASAVMPGGAALAVGAGTSVWVAAGDGGLVGIPIQCR